MKVDAGYKGVEICKGHSGTWHLHYAHLAHYHMPPKTLIVTLGDVLGSDNAKTRVNPTRSVCAGCGDEVLCGAGMPFLDWVNECWSCAPLSHNFK